MITVKVYHVDSVDCDVDSDERQYESWESVLDEVRKDYGETDCQDHTMEWMNDGDQLIFEMETGFVKYEIIANPTIVPPQYTVLYFEKPEYYAVLFDGQRLVQQGYDDTDMGGGHVRTIAKFIGAKEIDFVKCPYKDCMVDDEITIERFLNRCEIVN